MIALPGQLRHFEPSWKALYRLELYRGFRINEKIARTIMAQINMKYSYMADAFIKTLGLTLMLSGLAQAAEKPEAGWEKTASTPDFIAYLNTQSITQEGRHVKYWIRKDFLTPQVSDEGPDFVRDQSLYAADCSARSSALASTIRYSKSGSVIKRVSKLPNELKFEAPLPESIEAAHLKRVCESR